MCTLSIPLGGDFVELEVTDEGGEFILRITDPRCVGVAEARLSTPEDFLFFAEAAQDHMLAATDENIVRRPDKF